MFDTLKFYLAFAFLLFIISCRVKRDPCPDEFKESNYRNSIKLSYYFESAPTLPYNLDSLQVMDYWIPETNNYVAIRQDYNIGSNAFYLYLNVNSERNTFIITGTKFTDTLAVSGFNPRVIYYDDKCGYQLEIDNPSIVYTTMKNYNIKSFDSDQNILEIEVLK